MVNNLFKRLLAFLLALITLLLACSCGEDSADPTLTDQTEQIGSETVEEDHGEQDGNSGELEELVPEDRYYSLSYLDGENGRVEGERKQTVKSGESASGVMAIADEGYVFSKWSDGCKQATRLDAAVYSDIEVYPIFVSADHEYSVTYAIYKNGSIVEKYYKTATAGETVSFELDEIPLAYAPSEWSDGVTTLERVDTVASDGEVFVINFEPLCLNGIPTIEITTADGSGVTDKDNYKSCVVSLSNADEDDCFEGLSAQIKGRGNSSWSYPKKGFRLKFDKKRSMLGSDYKAKSWLFISNYGDKSLIRNMITYDMAARFHGLDYTVKHEYIDVYLDGEYVGLYMMTDNIDIGEGKIDYGDEPTPDPKETAFIIEIGATDPGVKGVDYFSADGRSYCINFPNTDDPGYHPDIHLKYIQDYINQCLKALSAKDWDLICELIDIDSFVDYYIIQEMLMNKDGFWRSIHFYKEPNGKLYAGPVWDFDQGAGNVDGFYGEDAYDTHPSIDIPYENLDYKKQSGVGWIAGVNTWYRRLMRNDEFVEILRGRLREYGPIIKEVLRMATTDGSEPNSYYMLYGDAMERNFEKWKIMGKRVWPNTPRLVEIDTLKEQIDYVYEWLHERYDVLCDLYDV